jgi:hypothetical protein
MVQIARGDDVGESLDYDGGDDDEVDDIAKPEQEEVGVVDTSR